MSEMMKNLYEKKGIWTHILGTNRSMSRNFLLRQLDFKVNPPLKFQPDLVTMINGANKKMQNGFKDYVNTSSNRKCNKISSIHSAKPLKQKGWSFRKKNCGIGITYVG